MNLNSSCCKGKPRFSGLKNLVKARRSVSVKGIENEEKQKTTPAHFPWVLNPRSHIRYYYLVYMVLLTFVNLITIPLDMAFSGDLHGSAHKYWLAFNLYSDIMFCIDVGLNFRMGIFSEDGEAILDPKLIREDYFKTWFVPDVIAAFPVDIVIVIMEHVYHAETLTLMASKMVRILMFVRILSMVRLLRVPKLLRFCFELENVSDVQLEEVKKAFRVFFVFLMMVLIWHWNSCIQYFLSVMEDFPHDSWAVHDNIVNTSIGEKYSLASYRAFSQMAWRTTKATDSIPRVDERWLAVVSMVIGYLMCFAFICSLISAVGSVSVSGSAYKMKINQLQSSSMFQKLPRVLRQRTSAQYKWQWDKNNILKMLSKRLRKDIMAHICSNVMKKDSLFMTLNREFTEAILMKLENEFFTVGDIIIHQDSQADQMFFIDYGRVLVKNESVQMELSDGDHFGEISFLFGGRQLATVSALTACNLFSLSFEDFLEIEEEFPDVVNELRAAAQELKTNLENEEAFFQVTSASSNV